MVKRANFVGHETMNIILREGREAWCTNFLCMNIRHDPYTRLCWDCKVVKGMV